MISEIEHKGIWWLPENEDRKIDGMLKFNPQEGSTLDLSGSLRDMKDIMKVSKWDIILGFTVTGKEVTLLHNYLSGTQLHLPGIPTSSIVSNFVFIGAHFPKKEDILFKNMSIRYTFLDEWIDISGFSVNYSSEEKEFILKYKLPEPLTARIDNDFTIKIQFKATRPVAPRNEAVIKQDTEIEFEPPEEKHFDFFQQISHHIQNFLSLATMKAVYPIFIMGGREEKTRTPVEVYYQNSSYLSGERKILSPYDMLFTFNDIKNNFESYFQKWFEKAALLRPVCDLYFGTLYNPRMYIEHRFLSLCQAIEAYHRRINIGKYESDNEYRNKLYPILMNAIPNGINKNFKESMKTRLLYLNEYSLRKRLEDILKTHSDIISPIIPHFNQFIGNIVNIRNFFTHYDEELKDKAQDGESLFILTERLKFIIEVCLLFELGFEQDQIARLIQGTQKYNYIKTKKTHKDG